MKLSAIALALTLVLYLLVRDSRADIPPAICFGPGACRTSYQPNLDLVNYQYAGPQSAATGTTLNVYIAWGNDAAGGFTNTQKTIIIKLFQHLGSSTWFQNLENEWPSGTGQLGSAPFFTGISLTNCAPVDTSTPQHCFDVAQSSGASASTDLLCSAMGTAGLAADPNGIGFSLYNGKDIVGSLSNGAGCSNNKVGHSVLAMVNPAAGNNCFGTTDSSVAPINTTTSSFTQPAVSSTASVTMTSSNSNSSFYIDGCGDYSATTGSTSVTLTRITQGPGPPVTINTGSTCNSGASVRTFRYPDTPNEFAGASSVTPGCYFDQLITTMLGEMQGALGAFHGQAWGGATTPSSESFGELHESCGIGLNPWDNTFTAPSGVLPSNFGFTDTSVRYDFLLPKWLHATQGSQLVGFNNNGLAACGFSWTGTNGVYPGCGYCASQNYANYWNVPCKQNSDCPPVSGHCSGTGYGSHCIAPTCSDGIKNGFESDIDCGGNCNPCGSFGSPGTVCNSLADCSGNAFCNSGTCTSW